MDGEDSMNDNTSMDEEINDLFENPVEDNFTKIRNDLVHQASSDQERILLEQLENSVKDYRDNINILRHSKERFTGDKKKYNELMHL